MSLGISQADVPMALTSKLKDKQLETAKPQLSENTMLYGM
jgi:hypothetical protein